MEFYAMAQSLRERYKVSIPNGMEFYLGLLTVLCDTDRFQFPTGWNSTAFAKILPFPSSSFNSQRDGILPMTIFVMSFFTQVSIPNGMEFYSRLSRLTESYLYCFNSQRDGILLELFCDSRTHRGFQFPTGWNSTLAALSALVYLLRVSIPNGMEFYLFTISCSSLSQRFQFPTGWNSTASRQAMSANMQSFNSQRDGILRSERLIGWKKARKVSIPNGMEFYGITEFEYVDNYCFNSQRDGILQCQVCLSGEIWEFQFPTGWNSTFIRTSASFKNSLFQFPTGWNSTLAISFMPSPKLAFQFPTGWNSTFRLLPPIARRCVSIPNGMEFYRDRERCKKRIL